jgi:hypothetical protein
VAALTFYVYDVILSFDKEVVSLLELVLDSELIDSAGYVHLASEMVVAQGGISSFAIFSCPISSVCVSLPQRPSTVNSEIES